MSSSTRKDDGLAVDSTLQAITPVLPVAVLLDHRLSFEARILFGMLEFYARYSNRPDRWPGLETIASDLNTSDRSVRTWMGELAKLGYVTVHRTGGGKPNTYTLHVPTLPPNLSIRQPASDQPSTERTDDRKPASGQNRSQQVIDGLREAGLNWALVPRDHGAIKRSDWAPEQIVTGCVRAAEAHQQGNRFWQDHLSVWAVIDRLPSLLNGGFTSGNETHRGGTTGPHPGPTPQGTRSAGSSSLRTRLGTAYNGRAEGGETAEGSHPSSRDNAVEDQDRGQPSIW